MTDTQYEYYWNETKQRFILLADGVEVDEYRTEQGLKMYAKNAIHVEKPTDSNYGI